ncbi:MAG TPA: YigZ family protein [Gemmatimonadaceae bacterium]|nr:YigZ family protein [Gemmatimonadaceae bacterium]
MRTGDSSPQDGGADWNHGIGQIQSRNGCTRGYDCMMHDVARYPVPAADHRVEQTIERSRFICTVRRVESPGAAQSFIREMSAEFADASHNCWAYVAGPPGSTNVIGMSDAGEPHGTAGRPMLTVLLHSGVGEIAAVVTRYFGGTKLGTGGLVKAYGGIVQLALESLPLAERVDYAEVTLSIGYPNISVVQQAIASLGAEVLEQEYGLDVRYRLRIPRANAEALRTAVADATRGEGAFSVISEDAG